MSSDVIEPNLTPAREKAAVLVADDLLSDVQIAAECGVTQRTLARWKLDPVFTARVALEKSRLLEALRVAGISNKQNRLDSYVSDFNLTSQIMTERAADTEIAEGPGGKTGLIVRTIKGIGSGDNFMTVEEFAFDAALLSARQSLRREIAEELGERQTNLNLTGTTTVRLVGISEDDV